jgi:hypothetical protein
MIIKMDTPSYPFMIIGSTNCERCKVLQKELPSAVCHLIPEYSLGLGDTIAKIIYALTKIESCQGCKVRRSWLNTFFPYWWVAPSNIRQLRNDVLRLGYEELPVLLDWSRDKVYDIDDFVPGFTAKYMAEEH